MEMKESCNSTQKNSNERYKRSFAAKYNDPLEKLFNGIVNRIRHDADLYLMLKEAILVETVETETAINHSDVSVLDSHLQELDLKNKSRKLDKNIDAKIKETVDSISISENKANSIADVVIKDLKTSLKSHKFTSITWTVYGSYKNGFCTNHSDTIDLSGDINEYVENSFSAAKDLVLKFSKIFEKHPLFRLEEFHENARVPIIVLFHTTTSKKVNVTFFNEFAVRNLSMSKLYLNLNPNLKILTLYLKHLMIKYELHGKNKITTHMLYWLVIYYFQEKGLLPAVKDIRKAADEKHYVSGWNCSLPRKFKYKIENSSTISSLLLDFFSFYKKFDFLKYVMSPYHGCAFPLEEFERSPPIPKDAIDDLHRSKYDGRFSFLRHGLNFQDPVVLDYNLAIPIRTDRINLFNVFCYRFATGEYLPEKLPQRIEGYGNEAPLDLERYASFVVFLKKIPSPFWQNIQERVLFTVRKMMEVIFQFELGDVVEQNITRIIRNGEQYLEKTFPVIYFNYYSTENTWKNDHVLRVFFEDTKWTAEEIYHTIEKHAKRVQIYLVCEIRQDEEKIYVWIRTQNRLTKFFHLHFGRLMIFILLL